MRLISPRSGLLTAALLTLFETAKGHTWPESTRRIAPNGTFIGYPGYDRSHIARGVPLINGEQPDYLLPPNDPPGKIITPDLKLVRPSQRPFNSASYSEKFPMLKVAPGDFVAIFYAENGHVSKADTTNPNKPINRGTVYLYGTTENDLSETNLVDVLHTWNKDGTGGNKKGRLLATRNYDDGQCHEPIPGVDNEGITTYRMAHISNVTQIPCQSDLQIPLESKPGDILTILWVWDWPDMNKSGVAVPPVGFHANSSDFGEHFVTIPEIYTGVVDYQIVDPCDDSLGEVKGPTCTKGTKSSPFSGVLNSKKRFRNRFKFDSKQPAENRAIQRQMAQPFMVKVPQAGFGSGNKSSAKFFPVGLAREGLASADKANIPLAALIGKETKPPVPFSRDILEGQTRYFDEEAVPDDNDNGNDDGSGEDEDNAPLPTSTASLTQTPTPTSSPTVPKPTDGTDPSIVPKPTKGTGTIAPKPTNGTVSKPPAPKPTNGAGTNPIREDGVFYVTVTVPKSFVTVTVAKTEKVTATATATASQGV